MSFKGDVRASLGWNWNDGAVDNNRLDYAEQVLFGNGTDQAEAAWHIEDQILLDGASITLDLTNLVRTVLGDISTVTFLKIKALLIVNLGSSVGQLLVGDAVEDPWSEPFGADGDQVLVPVDSPMLLASRRDGWAVDASNRNLRLAASGGDVDYSIALLGTVTAGGSGSGSGSGV